MFTESKELFKMPWGVKLLVRGQGVIVLVIRGVALGGNLLTAGPPLDQRQKHGVAKEPG